MEDKRKNIYIVFFVVTTIIASCFSIYFGINLNNKGKTYESVKNEINNIQDNTQIENGTKDGQKDNKMGLSQENVDKIAKTTIEDYINICQTMNASPANVLIDYLHFYDSYEDFANHTTNDMYGRQITDIKHDEFMNKITKYMPKERYDEINHTSSENSIYLNIDGYLAIYAGGGTLSHTYIDTIRLLSKEAGEYTYEVEYRSVALDGKLGDKNKGEFIIKNVDDTFVVSRRKK